MNWWTSTLEANERYFILAEMHGIETYEILSNFFTNQEELEHGEGGLSKPTRDFKATTSSRKSKGGSISGTIEAMWVEG
jgi:hypothetical protein